jgi:hypothetical protein
MRLTALIAVITAVVVRGAAAQTPEKPNMFATMSACTAALESGSLRFYEPKYFGLRTNNPVNNTDRVVVSLESDTCLEMLVVGGRRFVAQREGTLFRALKLPDGSLSLYARDDCGNPVYGVVYPPPPPALRTDVLRIPATPVLEPPPVVGPSVRVVPAPANAPKRKGGFCSSKKCRWALVAVGAAAGGYAAWYYWPCPTGTVRK